MKHLLVTIGLLVSLNLLAQKEKYQLTEKDYQNTSVEMADGMRQSGKIYVVVGVIAIVFGGIVFYLIRLDNKVIALETQSNQIS